MAKKGLHVNVYKLPDGTWRCDLKLNTTNAGEGVTVRGTSEPRDKEDPQLGWIPLVMLAAQYGPKVAELVAKARAAQLAKKKAAKAAKAAKRDDDDDDDVSGPGAGLSRPGRALAAARTIAGAMLGGAAAAALPDYVKPTLEVLKAIEVAERKGMLGQLRKQLTDPTLRKLASEMDQMQQGKRTAMSGGGCCLADGDRAMRGSIMRGQGPSFDNLSGNGRSFDYLGAAAQRGNPHPFGTGVAQDIDSGLRRDPLAIQQMARALKLQRERARQGG